MAAQPAYIVPFMFIYEPMLLLIVKDWGTQWPYVISAVLSASIGVVALAGSLFGWLYGFASTWHRVLLFFGALCLIKPGLATDLAGAALLSIVVVAQWLAARRDRETAVGTARTPGS